MTSHMLRKTLRKKRHARIRSRVFGTAKRPRLSFFRSNQHVYAQLVDDETGTTLAAASDLGGKKEAGKASQGARAQMVGEDIARKAKEKRIEKVVFDRGGFLYAGAVKSFADAARKGGLVF